MLRGTFEPDELAVLSSAFDQARSALSFALARRDADEAQAILKTLGKCVVRVGRKGERNPALIAMRALRMMPPLSAEARRNSREA
jgi:hypothetical protein